jgi:ribonuclease J
MSDSTNADREGYSRSEIEVLKSFDEVFSKAKGRIIIATFSSNIHRIQQIIDVAAKHRKRILTMGMSMEKNTRIASELGYLKAPSGMFLEPGGLNRCPPENLVVITTGSQGEPMSGLSRMAMGVDKSIKIKPGDTVVISARTIPGNERAIASTINDLFRLGAEVIYEQTSEVHVSGHASQEELKLMLNLVRPKFFVPVHGEYRHLVYHTRLAEMVGIRPENTFIVENGEVLKFTRSSGRRAGRIKVGKVLVDGKGVGDVGSVVLRDRQHLSQDGLLIVVVTLNSQTGGIVSGPEVISRGFVYVREAGGLLDEAREIVKDVLIECEQEKNTEWGTIKSSVKDALARFLYERTERRPMILPIIMEV